MFVSVPQYRTRLRVYPSISEYLRVSPSISEYLRVSPSISEYLQACAPVGAGAPFPPSRIPAYIEPSMKLFVRADKTPSMAHQRGRVCAWQQMDSEAPAEARGPLRRCGAMGGALSPSPAAASGGPAPPLPRARGRGGGSVTMASAGGIVWGCAGNGCTGRCRNDGLGIA
jgi:hypothetical protein